MKSFSHIFFKIQFKLFALDLLEVLRAMLKVGHLLDFFKNIVDNFYSFKLGNHSQLGTW
jgi:hypothetical protein